MLSPAPRIFYSPIVCWSDARVVVHNRLLYLLSEVDRFIDFFSFGWGWECNIFLLHSFGDSREWI